jgi:hypothetical protein
MKLYEATYGNIPIIAVYNGRFHPMGRHHVQTYERIVQIFGKDNTYVTTADKVKLPKSPLSFLEKEKIAIAHGINPDKFVFCRSGYQPNELHAKIQRERSVTADGYVIVFVVGEKDMRDDPRFSDLGGMTKPTKRNPVPRPKYLKSYDPQNLLPASEHGYVYTIPTVDIVLPDGRQSSGTNLRTFLYNSTPEEFKAAMDFFDQELYDLLKVKFDPVNLYPGIAINELKKRPKKDTQEYSTYLEELMDELKYIKSGYESRKKTGRRYRKEASKIQDAYSELRRLRNKNNKILNAQKINEVINQNNYVANIEISNDTNFNKDSIKNFLKKFK